MNPQHLNRRVRAELPIRRLLQYVVYLAVVLWLLYQIYQSLQIREGYSLDDIKNQFNDEQMGGILGRKGGRGTSSHAGERDLVGAADKIKHDAKDDDDEYIPAEGDEGDDESIAAEDDARSNDEKNYEEEYLRDHTEEVDDDEEKSSKNDDKGSKRRSYGQLSTKEGKTRKKVQQKKANNSTGNGGQKLKVVKRRKKGVKVGEKNRTEVGSLVNFGAVILKSVDKNWEVFQFNDENGVPKHESAPSRRSNIQVESLLKENKSSSGNDSKDLEACQILCLQHVLDKQSLSDSEAKAAVHEEMKEATEAEYGKESMRELLQKESPSQVSFEINKHLRVAGMESVTCLPKWEGKASAAIANAKAEEVWPLLADFCSLDRWFPTLSTCIRVEGVEGQPGCVRYCAGFKTHIEHADDSHVNWTKQKLLSIDSDKMTISYSIIDGNVGFNSYVSTVRVMPQVDGCNIEWSYEVEPVERWKPEDLDQFIGNGLKVMAKRMEEALNAGAVN